MKVNSEPTGISEIDQLSTRSSCSLQDYVTAASEYVKQNSVLSRGAKKASQIRLSNALGRVLASELDERIPGIHTRLATEETKVAGGLRTTMADVSETHPLDGLRLAVELKPINLAVGRAIWNRFGDIRTFAVNIHLKFPFCVVGGVLAIPTYERVRNLSKAVEKNAAGLDLRMNAPKTTEQPAARHSDGVDSKSFSQKSTTHLIERAIKHLIRSGGRNGEADASHLLEAVGVIVYDPDSATLEPNIPPPDVGLRWNEFIDKMAYSYQARFED